MGKNECNSYLAIFALIEHRQNDSFMSASEFRTFKYNNYQYPNVHFQVGGWPQKSRRRSVLLLLLLLLSKVS